MIDNRYIDIFTNNCNEWNYGFELNGFLSLQDDIIKGTISGYQLNDLFSNNSDYFINFQWFPFRLEKLFTLTDVDDLIIGKKSITDTYTAKSIKVSPSSTPATYPVTKWFSFSLARKFNNFLDFEPYRKVVLCVPFFEKINIDPKTCYGYRVDGYISVDITNGTSTLYIYLHDSTLNVDRLYDTRSCRISLNISMGKSNAEEKKRNNILQTISAGGSLIGLGVGVASGNPLVTAGSVGLLTKNVTQAIQNNVDRLSGYKGGSGDRSGMTVDKTIRVIDEYVQDVNLPDPAIKGYVLKETRSLSAVTGYTEISQMNFNPNGEPIMKDEIDEIVSLLRAGVIL